jgi:PGF-pre-PGF domain-containing protein
MTTSTEETADDQVAVDSIAFTSEADADAVTVTVTQSVDPTAESPAFDREDGTEDGGYVHVDHSIENDDVEDVTVRFRIHEDRLDPGERPDDVALYRHEDGTWNEVPTEQVDRTDDHYVFEAESPGLSNFVTGIKKPKFEIADAQVSVTEVRVEEGTEVATRVTNVGGSDGTFVLKLYQDDERVAAAALSISAAGTRQTTFDRTFDEPGIYQLYVNERFAGNVTVRAVETATPVATDGTGSPTPSPSPTARSTPESTPGSAPGFGPLTALVAVALLLGHVWRRR